MAVKTLKCKSLLLCVYQPWLSKHWRGIRKVASYYIYKLEGLLHLPRNTDIVNMWLNYCAISWRISVFIAFFVRHLSSSLNLVLFLAWIHTYKMQVSCLCDVCHLNYLKPCSPQISWCLHNSWKKKDNILGVRECLMKHIYNNQFTSHLFNFPAEF